MRLRVALAATLLLAGLLLTIGVAWMSAVRVDVLDGRNVDGAAAGDGRFLRVWGYTRPGGQLLSFSQLRTYAGASIMIGDDLDAILPWWSSQVLPADDFAADMRTIEARGWPLAALYSHRDVYTSYGGDRPDTEIALAGAFVTRLKPWTRGGAHPRLLPFQPLWIGLVANTLIYASAVWLGTRGPLLLRRRLRRRDDRCVACGYPIGTSGRCTECGAALTR